MGLASKLATIAVSKTSGKSNLVTELLKAKAGVPKTKTLVDNNSSEYKQTNILPKKDSSKNFENKFKGTKVVDKNKKPTVMYHGRTKDFDAFDTTGSSSPNQEIGIHLGPSEQANTFASKEGGNIVPAYLDVKNPLRLHDYGSFTADDVLEQLRSEGIDQVVIDSIEKLPFKDKSKAVVDLIKNEGYDGIVYLNRREGLNLQGSNEDIMRQLDEVADYDDETLRKEYGAKDSYVIFDPSQAKSVFNKGTYDEADDRFNYNKGGVVENEMNKLFAEGGVMQEGGTVDPVSGNDVPIGSMAEEVRDDIPAQLSEGEFVFPADVVRFYGLEKLMMMRDKAKKGLQKMADIGQMGNADEVEDADSLFGGEDDMDDDTFSSEIDTIMSDGGEQEYAAGGDVRKYAPGGYVGGAENEQLYRDAPIKGFEMVQMTNDAGQTLFIPFINGVAQLNVPDGYRVKKAGAVDTPPVTAPVESAPTQDSGGGGDSGPSDGGPMGSTAPDPSSTYGGIVAGSSISPTLGSVLGGILGFAIAGPQGAALGARGGKAAASYFGNAQSQAQTAEAIGYNLGVEGYSPQAVTAAQQAAAAASGQSGATPGSIAAAGAQAAANIDNTDPLDAMMATTNAFGTGTSGTSVSDSTTSSGDTNVTGTIQGDPFSYTEASPDSNSGGGGPSAGDSAPSDGPAGAAVSGDPGYAKGGLVKKRISKKTGKRTSFVTRQK